MSMYVWFSLMIIASVVWLIWFLKYPLKSSTFNLQKSNIELGKQKQAELKQDLAQGLIDEKSFDQAQEEITQTLAIELNQQGSTKVSEHNLSFWIIGFVLIALPVLSLGMYQFLKPQVDTLVTQKQPLSLAQSALEIKKHLQDNTNDFEAWQMLGLTYFELGKLDESIKAYEKSYQLNRDNAPMLVEYASALATSQGNKFSGRPTALVKEALEINPNMPDALYLAGLIAASAGQFDLAKQVWQRALSILPQGHPDRSILENILSELSTMQGEEDKAAGRKVVVNIKLSERLKSSKFSDYFIMVYAKSTKGRPMPIAIQKVKLKDFSGRVELTDKNSVMPSQKLSQSNSIIIVVRISQTGSAMKQAGDIQVLSKVVDVRDNPVVNLQVE